MPNWVFNSIGSDEDTINDIKKNYLDESGNFDFNKFIPMPEALNVTAGSENHQDILFYLSERYALTPEQVKNKPEFQKVFEKFDNFNKKIFENDMREIRHTQLPNYDMGKQLVDNLLTYGSMNWYDWCCENWDTKWNACDTDANDPQNIHFNTAWNVPMPILRKLCEAYPDADIDIFCEEESGWYVEFNNNKGELIVVDQGNVEYNEEDDKSEYVSQNIGF